MKHTMLKVHHHVRKAAAQPVIDMVPVLVSVAFEAIHMEWFHKAIVTSGALGLIGWHYMKRK